jgi:hypothetical protein
MEFKLRQSYFQNEIKVLRSKLNELDYLNQNAVRIIDYYQIEERGLKDNLARRISRLESLMINNSFLEIKNTEDLEKEKVKICWQIVNGLNQESGIWSQNWKNSRKCCSKAN